MDRQSLDLLYSGSQGSPSRVFQRAASEKPLPAPNHQFLLDHVQELDVGHLVTVFNAQLADGVLLAERSFVARLAALISVADGVAQLDAVIETLRLSAKISTEAWWELLTLPLKGRLPSYQWYRFVDKTRGGDIFNTLNVGIAPAYVSRGLDPDEGFCMSIEESRTEPAVVALLDRPYDDLAAAKFALETQPVPALLDLHTRFPRLVERSDLEKALASRIGLTTGFWAPAEGAPSFPTWMAPFVVQRLEHGPDEEARALYEWLLTQPDDSHSSDLFSLALERFRRAPLAPVWHSHLARYLRTGTAWKSRGRTLIDLCIDLGKGFPPLTLRAALNAAREEDGASVDQHKSAILRRVHDEAAKLLVDRAARAFKAGELADGDLYLSALLSLDCGSFVRGALRRLRDIPDLPAAVIARIEACEALTHAGGRDPTEDAFHEAFLVLMRQVS